MNKWSKWQIYNFLYKFYIFRHSTIKCINRNLYLPLLTSYCSLHFNSFAIILYFLLLYYYIIIVLYYYITIILYYYFFYYVLLHCYIIIILLLYYIIISSITLLYYIFFFLLYHTFPSTVVLPLTSRKIISIARYVITNSSWTYRETYTETVSSYANYSPFRRIIQKKFNWKWNSNCPRKFSIHLRTKIPNTPERYVYKRK